MCYHHPARPVVVPDLDMRHGLGVVWDLEHLSPRQRCAFGGKLGRRGPSSRRLLGRQSSGCQSRRIHRPTRSSTNTCLHVLRPSEAQPTTFPFTLKAITCPTLTLFHDPLVQQGLRTL
ncbi:hypothetical protein K443DRAFT_463325 [Laccaria amethystina LaAM-08-1]|uniref:Uncharacterized protein n=1 Tax=Laccaria amethystina LaAM-08-1 TaxID=1095629 RepID=A0A0C9WNJ9_9AGAR|nr:hypothetical protein K443DRAFT_463325 [Laccaria amethystina LaAM-08-1]